MILLGTFFLGSARALSQSMKLLHTYVYISCPVPVHLFLREFPQVQCLLRDTHRYMASEGLDVKSMNLACISVVAIKHAGIVEKKHTCTSTELCLAFLYNPLWEVQR